MVTGDRDAPELGDDPNPVLAGLAPGRLKVRAAEGRASLDRGEYVRLDAAHRAALSGARNLRGSI